MTTETKEPAETPDDVPMPDDSFFEDVYDQPDDAEEEPKAEAKDDEPPTSENHEPAPQGEPEGGPASGAAETTPQEPADESRDGLIAARKAEAEKRREAETRAEETAKQLADLKAQNELMMRQMQQFQAHQQPHPPKQEEVAPDPIMDPEGWQKHVLEEAKRQASSVYRQQAVEQSMNRARAEHGPLADIAASAYQAMFQQGRVDPAFDQKLAYDPHPVDTVVKWYREQVSPMFAPAQAPAGEQAPSQLAPQSVQQPGQATPPAQQMPTDISEASSAGAPPPKLSADDKWFMDH